ncbi:hypothetical protein DL771_009580 [Monosporascus sp. 5C6A]|nr:hypothetical protein DL771_009580 [Monosporascus sp. 5C6A]
MRVARLSAAIMLAAQSRQLAGAIPHCPYQGLGFPVPTGLASSATVQTALAELTASFVGGDPPLPVNQEVTSWSVQVFSASADEPLWEHYHTASGLGNTTRGVKEVDGDTIYRLGSNTKIFTMLTFLHEAGETYLNDPVSQWVPELADKTVGDPISDTDWDSITLGALASQMSGLVRDYALLGELTQEVNFTDLIALGFPPNVPIEDIPFCGEWKTCTKEEFMNGIASVPPSFAPSLTAGYSNAGYQLLAYALEAIKGRNFTEMIERDIIDALKLSSTYYRNAPIERGILPNGSEPGWNYSLGEANPTGNMYSSANDLSSLGRHIFRNTLLSGAATRRWLKPTTPTSDFKAGIGAPWGTRRIQIGTGPSSNRIIDSYAKAGSINVYQSLFLLIPDYEIGFTTLLAGGWPGNANWDMADKIGTILLPAIEQAAREQAGAMYGGTYVSTDEGLNSTVTFTTEDDRPGLGVQNWISNGTDMFAVMMFFTMPGVNITNPAIRIYPAGLEARNDDGSRRVAFKAVAEDLNGVSHENSMFSTDCGKWVSQSTVKFASRALDQFVFDIDSSGNVVSVENQALRAKLAKQP